MDFPGAQIYFDNGDLVLEGYAYGGPTGEEGLTSFTYRCTDVSGTAPGPIEANSCSGSYTHEPTGTTVNIVGKGRAGDNVELAIYQKYSIIRGEGWYTFEVGFDSNARSAGDFVFKIGCGPFCGNGILEPGEFCDPADEDFDGECREDCTYCGDGVVQTADGENCDPADDSFEGECREDCTYCGDGVVQEGEGCDPAADDAPEGCRDDCTRCGDGIVQPEFETCDYNDPSPDAPDCRGADDFVDEFDCTYCGDGVLQAEGILENCEPPGVGDCSSTCGIDQGPECVTEFDGVTCGEFNLINGPHGHGIFARGSFWPGNDYDPRPFTGGLFNYCPGSEMNFAGTFDNLGTECEIEYSCASVDVGTALQTTATDCSGSMTCGDETIDLTGKSNGVTETDCWVKYVDDPWQCVSWFTFPDGAGGVVQGDLVWSGECPPESIGGGQTLP